MTRDNVICLVPGTSNVCVRVCVCVCVGVCVCLCVRACVRVLSLLSMTRDMPGAGHIIFKRPLTSNSPVTCNLERPVNLKTAGRRMTRMDNLSRLVQVHPGLGDTAGRGLNDSSLLPAQISESLPSDESCALRLSSSPGPGWFFST
jgi:hypothetical protein